MPEQEFETPQEALAHYGKKGMRWGVRNDDKSSGGGAGGSSKPKEDSESDLSKALETVYGSKSKAELNAEGKAKLKAQAETSFPTKGAKRQAKKDQRAETLEKQASDLKKQEDALQKQFDDLPPGVRSTFKRSNLQSGINYTQNAQKSLLKEADQLREGKLTDRQKLLIGLGATAAVAGLAVYGTRQYELNQAGITKKRQQEFLDHNRDTTKREWETLFGKEHEFTKAQSAAFAGSGGFYAGLSNKKALKRPEFEIPEGTIFQRLSNHQEDSADYGKVKGAYATFLNNDKKLYGASSEFGSSKYTVEFQAKGPVKVPSHATVMAHFRQVRMAESPNLYKDKTPEKVTEMLSYEYHSQAGGSWSDATAMKLFGSLKSFGYGAIVDDMDAGYLGDLPVVFFGDAKPASSTPRTQQHQTKDSVGVLHLSGQYA